MTPLGIAVLFVLFGGFLLWLISTSESNHNEEIRKISDAINARNLIEQRKLNELVRRNLFRETKIPPAPKQDQREI